MSTQTITQWPVTFNPLTLDSRTMRCARRAVVNSRWWWCLGARSTCAVQWCEVHWSWVDIWQLCLDQFLLILVLDCPPHRCGIRLSDRDGLCQCTRVRYDVTFWPFGPRVRVALLWLANLRDKDGTDELAVALLLLFLRILQLVDFQLERFEPLKILPFGDVQQMPSQLQWKTAIFHDLGAIQHGQCDLWAFYAQHS